jgi:hypothetical protein
LMVFSFSLLSDKMNSDSWFCKILEEMDSHADFALSKLDWFGQRNICIHNNHLDATSSLMFMLANALFNTCVALKISLCTKV